MSERGGSGAARIGTHLHVRVAVEQENGDEGGEAPELKPQPVSEGALGTGAGRAADEEAAGVDQGRKRPPRRMQRRSRNLAFLQHGVSGAPTQRGRNRERTCLLASR